MTARADKAATRGKPAAAGKLGLFLKGRLVKTVLLIALGVGVLGAGAGLGFCAAAWRELPALTTVEPRIQATSFVYDRNGEIVTGLAGPINRVLVSLEDIPKHVKDAFVAQEDHNFYTHHGIVLRRILAAAYADLTGGMFQGASTITQQLARTAFLSLERTMTRKVQEALLAIQMERLYTKNELLEMYLNLINLGTGGYGVQAAAMSYFGKDVSELTLAEGAMLAGMARSPQTYSPYRDLELGTKRMRQVLAQMVKRGYISQEEADEAADYEFVLPGIPDRTEYPYPFFIDYVLDQLLNEYKLDPDTVYSSGLHVYTTLDPMTQAAAEAAVEKYKPNLPVKGDERAEIGLVVMENETGYLRAIVGGVEHTQHLQYNVATQARRQPGSAFKPIVDYTAAIDLGYSPSTVVDDAPLVLFTLSGESWMPSNYSPRFLGLINFRIGLERSINTAAVRVLNMIGIRTGIEYAQRMGIESLVTEGPRNDITHSLSLGALTHGVSPLELTRAYAVLGNQGVKVQPTAILKVVDRYGHVLIENQPRKEVVLSRSTAWLVTDMLVGVINASHGTGTRARLSGWTAAGKTGTSEDHADAWFAGYTAKHTCTVWLGFPKERVAMSSSVVGGMYPALIWKETMTAAHAELEPVGFERPPEIVEVEVCKKSGKLPGPDCPASDIVREVFLRGHEPKEVCSTHVSARICLDDPTHLAGENCPEERTVWKTFIRREPYVPWVTSSGTALVPEDASMELPAEYCRYHQTPGAFVPDREIELTMSGYRFNPSEIRVSAGERIRLVVSSVGRTYSMAIDRLGLSIVCAAGETKYLDFVAESGTYNYYCNMDVGANRSKMVGRLIVD